ncbi:unnamed protein product, partial [Ectocarpus sp. 6 AP-2014]
MRKRKAVPIVVAVVVLFAIYSGRVNEANHKLAVQLSNSVQDVLTKAILSDMESVLEDLQWEKMLRDVDSITSNDIFQRVPNLLSISTSVLVERADEAIRSLFSDYIKKVLRTRDEALSSKIALVSQLAMNNLRTRMQKYTSDEKVLGTFEKNMEVIASVLADTSATMVTDNTNKRMAKISEIFEQVLHWKILTYGRFLHHVQRSRVEMDAGSQLRNWVELETQQIVADDYLKPLQVGFFEQYIANRVISILAGQFSRLLGIRLEQIDTDAVLDDDQKRALKQYASNLKKASEASRQIVTTSIGEIRELYLNYADRLLQEVIVVITAAFLEYEAISLRAIAEGRQTCIIQFFDMRTAMDEAFFFEYCKDRDFDIDLTRSDFAADLSRSLQQAPTAMFSLTRTAYILDMYEEARGFLLDRVSVFFRDDVILLEAVKPMLADLHDGYASTISQRLQQGIDEEVAEETEIARFSVQATFDRFADNMELSIVLELINGSRDSILQDMQAKLTEIDEEFSTLTDTFVREALEPFDFAWFTAQSQEFTTDDQIRFIDMKQHVVDLTNSHASVVLEDIRSANTSEIATLFGKASAFVSDVQADLQQVIDASTRQDSESVELFASTLAGMRDSMDSVLNTMHQSTLVNLEATLGHAMVELENVQGIRLRNFFNTKIQKIKDDFTVTVTERITDVYTQHLGGVETKMLSLSASARSTYRSHVDELLTIERNHRTEVEKVVAPVLNAEADIILADFNIVSFEARRTLLVQQMRNAALEAAREIASQRRLSLLQFKRTWDDARAGFSLDLAAVADNSKVAFRRDVLGVVSFAKTLASDVIGHVAGVIDSLERELFHHMETAFTNVVNAVIGTTDNELPEELNLESVVSAHGIMDLTDTPVIPMLAFQRDAEEEGPDTTYDENGQAQPSIDEPSGLTTLDIVLALMSWDDWIDAKVAEIVHGVVISMQDELRQNTCRRHKPPCREGWVQFQNSFGVECCYFDPPSQGYLSWQTARMLSLEIALSMLLDLGNIKDVAVGGYVLATKQLSTRAAKKAGAQAGNKIALRTFTKISGKSAKSMNKGIALAGKTGGKQLSKQLAKTGATVGVKAGGKIAAKAGTKLLAKAGLGPFGIALILFDVVSIILDLWDPAGYGDAQTAGLVRAERDAIEKWYAEHFSNTEGIDSPVLADPMFNIAPWKQEQFYLTCMSTWLEEKVADYALVHEKELEALPDTEVDVRLATEFERLRVFLSEDDNLATTLVAAKLENVFLQDISVRDNHRNPFTEGGNDSTREHTRSNNADTGVVEMVLNETGVEAFNAFHVKKNAFLGSLKYNPMKRFVKRENNYIITRDVTSGQWFMETGTPSNRRYQFQNAPTVEASIAIAKTITNAQFRNEIFEMADDGWALVAVDADEEFWVQFDSNKSIEELLDRTKYQLAHDKRAKEANKQYELDLNTHISLELLSLQPESGHVVKADDLLVVHLAETSSNWTTDTTTGNRVLKFPVDDDVEDFEKINYTLETLPSIPDWAGTYIDHRHRVANELEQAYVEAYATQQEEAVANYDAAILAEEKRLHDKADEQNRAKKNAEDEDITPEKVLAQEREQGRNTTPEDPEFAVFLNGYGQSSPLYSIFSKCTSLGRGVEYDVSKGLCNFTESYCSRFGLDFFYNEDLAVYDCELSRGQAAAEYLFGFTVTRSVRRGGEAA